MPTQLALLITGVARSAYGQWKLQRLLPLVLVMALLTLVAAMLISVTVVGGSYALYLALLNAGIEPMAAACIVAVAFVFVTVAFVAMLKVAFIRGFKRRKAHAGEAIDAFLDGFLTE